MASTAAVESVDSRTLFVKGISFASTQQQLEQAFSQIGPVRSCFLIKHSSAQKHKVHFWKRLLHSSIELIFPAERHPAKVAV